MKDLVLILDDQSDLMLETDAQSELVLESETPVVPHYAAYGGPYEATPSQEEQVFRVRSKLMVQDFVVNPIPSNYGLITYNGRTITVS